MASEGWEELVRQDELSSVILPSILESLKASDDAVLDLELLDMVIETPNSLTSSLRGSLSASGSSRNGRLSVLVSHVPLEEDQDMYTGSAPRRIYLIVQISVLADVLRVDQLITVPYQSVGETRVYQDILLIHF
jgi:hypothetical protein